MPPVVVSVPGVIVNPMTTKIQTDNAQMTRYKTVSHTEHGGLNGLVNCTNVRTAKPRYIICYRIQVFMWKPWKLHHLTVAAN